MENNMANCNLVVDKYRGNILGEYEIREMSNKIVQYYTYRAKKTNVCLFCKKPRSKNEYVSKYDPITYARTLQIKCIHDSSPCKGWGYTYGVRFNIYNAVKELKDKIESMKTKIIINKNNMLYGYTSIKESKKIHSDLVYIIDEETNTYKKLMYDLLSYTDNPQLTSDLGEMDDIISSKILEIKQYSAQDNFKEVINLYSDISKLNDCVRTIKSFICTVYSDQLIKLSPNIYTDASEEHIAPDTLFKSKKKKASTKNKPISKPVAEIKNTISNDIISKNTISKDIISKDTISKDTISNVIQSAKGILSDNNLLDDPDSVYDLDAYMSVLKQDIAKGTPDQIKEYKNLLEKYTDFKSPPTVYNPSAEESLEAIEL